MANEKRLIDANAFWNLLQLVVYDIFTVHECGGQLTSTASVGYYTTTIEEVLKQPPTVDAVEVVHGRWIEKQEPITWCEDDVEVFWECSICGCLSFGESNYCPNCGADMR